MDLFPNMHKEGFDCTISSNSDISVIFFNTYMIDIITMKKVIINRELCSSLIEANNKRKIFINGFNR